MSHDPAGGPTGETFTKTKEIAKLGLVPSEERPGGLLYRCAAGAFAVFQSAGASSGSFTQMAWEVDDIEAVVAELRARAV